MIKITEKAKQRGSREIEESVGGGAEGLDKVKGIRVFILCFVIKKKKALIRSWLRYCLLSCGYCCLSAS